MTAPDPPSFPIHTVASVEALTPRERDDLAALLIACVADGASLGFLDPLDPEQAAAWWARRPAPGETLLVAKQAERIVGAVLLQPVDSENGLHRADVSKLVVHPASRRQGIARALMARLEAEAQAANKTLLVLDTREGDPSNALYQSLGYRQGGRIPGWARDAHGALSATIFWYKPV